MVAFMLWRGELPERFQHVEGTPRALCSLLRKILEILAASI
jgi:hypothetical protein